MYNGTDLGTALKNGPCTTSSTTTTATTRVAITSHASSCASSAALDTLVARAAKAAAPRGGNGLDDVKYDTWHGAHGALGDACALCNFKGCG